MQGKLTLKTCYAAPPGKHPDGNFGLYLYVKPSGTRSWVQAVRVGGKRTDLGLGKFPVVRLTDARKAALENVRSIHRGIDPRKPKTPKVKPMTFREAAELAIPQASNKAKDPAEYIRHRMMLFEKHVFPIVGDHPIADIDTPEVLAVLRPLSEAGKTWTTLKSPISTVVDWALLEKNRTAPNPVALVAKSLDRRPNKPHDSLHAVDLAERLKDYLHTSRSKQATKMGVLLTALTGARIGSVNAAVWSEFDLEAGLWVAGSMKGGKHDDTGFHYPLPRQAVDALMQLPRRRSEKVFSVGADSMRRSVKQHGIPNLHGIRSSLTDWARLREVSRDVQEALLAHKDTKLRQSYARDTLVELRRPITQEWADFLLPNGLL